VKCLEVEIGFRRVRCCQCSCSGHTACQPHLGWEKRRHTFILGGGDTLSELHFLTILVEPRLIYLISYIHAKGEDLRFPSATE
jgi:hypothetical protein